MNNEQLDPLQEAVNQNNPYGFLISYLDQIKSGRGLTLPLKSKEVLIRQEWVDICESMKFAPSKEFIESISELWTNIVTQLPQETKIDKSAGVHNELIDSIIELLKKSQIQANKQNSEQATVTHSISSEYYVQEKIKKQKVGSLKELKTKQISAINNKNVTVFLIHYLSILNLGKTPNFPVTSILEEIKVHWEDVFMKEFGIGVDDRFLENVSKKWFYFMNQYGLPVKEEVLDKIRVALQKELKEKKVKQKSQTKNFKETKKSGKIDKVIKVIKWLTP